MHVAHFIQRFPPALGGSESYFARLGEYLAAQGDSVSVWTTAAIELGELWGGKPQTKLAALQAPAIRRFPPLAFPARRYLLKALSLLPARPWQCLTMPCNPICPGMWREAGRFTGPLEAVHASAFPYSFPILCGLRLARRRRVPFFLTPFLHFGDPEQPNDRTRKQYTAPHLRWLLNQADGVFVQTEMERDAVLDLGVEPRRIVLQGLGVDPAECTGGNRARTREGWGARPDEPVVGHLANCSFEKGTIDLVLAAERAWAAGSRFRLVLAGPEMPNFTRFARSRRSLIRLGRLGDQEKRDFLAGIDVFALPSRSDSFGLVLLEAWANGKPNLVYRAGGPAELIRHEGDGLQARCGDVNDLASQLTRLVNQAELRERLGAIGQARLDREFRWEEKLEIVRQSIRESMGQGAERRDRVPEPIT